jgi:hypothetical protein
MLAVHPTGTEPDTPRPDRQASPQAVAEWVLHSSRYSALKHVSCDYQGGVLVLRGCLPTYYLKQIAQEVVSHQVDRAERLENRIEVVRAAVQESPPDKVNLDVLDAGQGLGESSREVSPAPDRRTETAVAITAPYGEQIEVGG